MNRIAVCLAASLVAALVACTASSEEEMPVGETNDGVTSSSQLNGAGMAEGTYALTFDDGPGGRTEELANWLGDRGIVATFFINGKNAPGRQAALDAVIARGHILANHTQNHENMRELYGADLYAAVADTDAVIRERQPNGPWLLRAPYGAWNTRVSTELNASDMSKYAGSIFWDVGGELTATTGADWACWSEGLSVDDCAQRYMTEMRSRGRGIILMHDTHARTTDMTKIIVETFGASKFVSITNAPAVASAVGNVVPTPPPPPGPPPPAPPPPASGCGNVDYIGYCETPTKIVWCEDGALKSKECAAGNTCKYQDARVGWNCIP
jgi:peptidoglycan/xylan/chitin deacetylase (PgdA/CDA1 family)